MHPMKQPVTSIGRYEVLQVLGQGATGTVYKARDPEIGRLVAIKTFGLHHHEVPSTETLNKFREESKAAGSLRHPNIVALFEASTPSSDVSVSQSQLPYVILDFVEGEGLHSILAREKVLSRETIIRYANLLAGVLDYAHGRGVVHGELKPSNIIIDKVGHLYVRDFGVSLMHTTLQEDEDGEIRIAHAYDAPELIEGHSVDYRADLFSFAVVVFECLVGVHPFGAEGRERLVESITQSPPEPPSSINPQLSISVDIVFSHALAKEPLARYPSARAFVDALLRALQEDPQPSLAQKEIVAPVSSLIPEEPLMPPLMPGGRASTSVEPSSIQEPLERRSLEPAPSVPFRTKALLLLVMATAIFWTYTYRETGSLDGSIDAAIRHLTPSEEFQARWLNSIPGRYVRSWSRAAYAVYDDWTNPAPSTDGKPVQRLTEKELLSLMVSARDNLDRVESAIAEAKRRGVPLTGLAPFLLNSPFPRVRAEGVLIMGTRKDSTAVSELLLRLRDPDAKIRFLVVERLALIDEPRVLPSLGEALLIERDREVKRLIKATLEHFEPETILPAPTYFPLENEDAVR